MLPDHLHCIWTLPAGDADFSTCWNLLKGHFYRAIDKGERVSPNRMGKRERGLWQSFRVLLTPLTYIHVGNAFWAHLITDESDYNRHIDYIHWNPVKHGWAKQAADWPHSSFHQYVKLGIYPLNWGYAGKLDLDAGE